MTAEMGTTKCVRCGLEKSLVNFHSERLSGIAKSCDDCRVRMSEAAYHRRRTRTRESRRREWMPKKYGISYEEFLDLLASQRGCCAICGTDQPGGKHDWWSVDHDHTLGDVRGVLCTGCNVGLGAFRDSTQTMRSAIAYLDRASRQ